jgi:DNA replicative helicase MCM subunit Mcm2 (Cdc46/Mcm family)
MSEEKEDWTPYIKNERVQKSLTMNVEIFAKVRKFQEEYKRDKTSRALEDLILIGLANLGYVTQEDITKRFTGFDLDLKNITLDKPDEKYSYIDMIATGISHSQHQRMRTVLGIIQELCDESKDGYAPLNEILNWGEAHGIDAVKVSDILDRMKRNGHIFEPLKDRYRVTED